MRRSRALAALGLALAVLWGAAAMAGAQTTTEPPTTTVTVTTGVGVGVSDSMPVSSSDGLPSTGASDPAGLSLFGVFMVGVGMVTLIGSRRLLGTGDHRR